MKNYLLLLFFCSLSLFSKSQVVTGVYKGKMVSDSLKYSVDFELTLKEKNGELYGYCQRLFLIDDVLYYNLVKVKARIKDSVLIVEDEKSVSNNFKEKTKGIKTVYMFNIKDIVDTAGVLNGDWSTSGWRNNYAMPGKLIVNRERNYLATQLYKRLEEKKLSQEMLFEEKPNAVLVSNTTKPQPTGNNTSAQNKPGIKPVTDPTVNNVVTVTNPEQIKPKTNDVAANQTSNDKPTTAILQTKPVASAVKDSTNKTSVVVTTQQQVINKPTDVAVNKPATTTQKPTSSSNTNKPVTTNNSTAITTTQQTTKPVVANNSQQKTSTANQPNNKPPVTTNQQNQAVVNNNNKPINTQQTKPQQQNTTASTTIPAQQKPTTPVVTTPVTTNQPTINPVGNTVITNSGTQPQVTAGNPPVLSNPLIVKRQVEIIEALEISEDSVVLSLYDNGEIDGDTVSVFLNNELLVSKIGIKASAYKKTIAVKKGEIIQLTLFAENLGSIPPNTGLLIITTGNERYQVNFSSTLNKSSSIVLKRKE